MTIIAATLTFWLFWSAGAVISDRWPAKVNGNIHWPNCLRHVIAGIALCIVAWATAGLVYVVSRF